MSVDTAARTALRRLVLGLADSKRLLGIRYSDWLLGAPSIEAGIAASSMCQDEWGHARLLYAMLKELDLDPREVEHERSAGAYASVDSLDRPFEDWAAVVAAAVVVDGAISTALEGFSAGGFELAASRVPKMLAEEEFHRDFAAAWCRRLAAGTDAARDAVRQAALAFMPRTLAWLAPDDDSQALLEQAGLHDTRAALVERYLAGIGSVMATVGLDVSEVVPDRSDWDAERGRGPGHPAEEAVERARGDRNRALFVE